jgi:hypothetical protein
MKKNLIYSTIMLLAASFTFTACSEDELSSVSVIVADKSSAPENDLDRWLTANFLDPYNIEKLKEDYENKIAKLMILLVLNAII